MSIFASIVSISKVNNKKNSTAVGSSENKIQYSTSQVSGGLVSDLLCDIAVTLDKAGL
ncbi:hypothetical protein DDB_G0285549 [Dictyostelium discoideum AX4]|uniref:Uncharacterized protein n=1 Tax=Dictyostelium discoideum TaxID=44689 RepID=Q54N24_DICDI|nr:hypothetical protein DDB_G0285549 [Dictyostelium discoideum AX4]EAL64612.1 hypothetical protein DDB_G0285549 [Dictyostelium discoideum AX4]|eukprot:XP_638119.1 hypothetical protein DDB_G0285549 [Dictyostelium discoideum AX4]